MSIGLAAAFCLPRWGLVGFYFPDVLPDVLLDVLDYAADADVSASWRWAACLAGFFWSASCRTI